MIGKTADAREHPRAVRSRIADIVERAAVVTLSGGHGATACAARADEQRFIGKGPAAFMLDGDVATRNFYFVMLPKMTMLAFSAAVEPLRIANQLTGRCLYRWFLLSEDGAPVMCSNGVEIAVDDGLVATKSGDAVFVCSGVSGFLAAAGRTVSWVREQARHGRMVGGLCTGAFTLARAGILLGRQFTLHWENQPAFEEMFPHLAISNQLYCRDGGIVTCGGGVATVDLFVSLIEEHHGRGLAAKVAEMCLVGSPRSSSCNQRLSVSAELGVRHPVLASVLRDIRANFGGELNVVELAARHGLSRRGLERLFRRHLDSTPARKVREIRVEHAHSLMAETDMSFMEVAVACGFQSRVALRRAYRQQFGAVPSARFGVQAHTARNLQQVDIGNGHRKGAP